MFHPLEDENLPKTICRDVPGEFRVSQLIKKYFKYRDPEGIKLLIKEDEDAIYHLLDVGMEEFRLVGQVYISESLKQWKVVPSPKVSVGAGVSSGWLEPVSYTHLLAGLIRLASLLRYMSLYRLPHSAVIWLISCPGTVSSPYNWFLVLPPAAWAARARE